VSTSTTSEAFFEAKYRQQADPWSFASDSYEQARYSAVIAALAGRQFKRTFEPGCSIGVLTERLAQISAWVEAIDISATAVSQAQERCSHLANVTVRQGALPDDIPPGEFDLLLFCEIGYYFDPPVLSVLIDHLAKRIPRNGVFLGAHWLGNSRDHRLHGEEVHSLIDRSPQLRRAATYRFSKFRIEQWIKT
jgi:SAM-dependent methyltransferase